MNSTVKLTTLFTLFLCMTCVGCDSPVNEPRIQLLDAAQTTELLTSAQHVEPVGEVVVNMSVSDTTTTITKTQLFSFRLNDDTGGSTGASCVGRCNVVGPGGIGGCVTSGCSPTKTGECTPLVCSGSCGLASACAAGTSMTVFSQ